MNSKLDKISPVFRKRLENIYSTNELEDIIKAFSIEYRQPTIRVNTIKSSIEEIKQELEKNNIKFEELSYLPYALIILNAREKDIWHLDIFTEGKIYLQQLSSQIPVSLMDINPDDHILDITAAPGGKTSQAYTKIWEKWLIIANDNNFVRLEKMRFNLKRLGCDKVEIVKNDAKKLGGFLSSQTFDKIIFDAPCSAEGRMNLHREKSYAYWEEKWIAWHSNLQKEIFDNIIPLLKKWWEIIYSTCTMAPEENEEVVDYVISKNDDIFLEEINIDIPNTKRWLIKFWDKSYSLDLSKTLRVIPNNLFEWFFVAKIKKRT